MSVGTGSVATNDLQERLRGLLQRQPKGASLLQEFYTDPEIYARDLSRVHLRRWLCVGHASRIPNPGDWFLYDVAEESIVVVRGRDGEVRALVNVCRHRGSQVCYEREGSSRLLVCPYHAWTYDLDGKLRSARHMGSDFDASAHSLRSIHARVVEGLGVVCFADDPPALDDVQSVLGESLGCYGWREARVAHRQTYTVDANWKLVTENYEECYHCRPAHPEFSRYHASEKPDAEVEELREAARARARSLGIDVPDVFHWPGGRAGQEGVASYFDATYPGSVTGSEDGGPVAPLMGDFRDYDGGFRYVEVGPASFFLAYPDHGVVYLFVPRAPRRTDMEITWLVRGDAREGVDYELERLTWMWHVTSLADKKIIDHNQRGVCSRYYRPGPYGPMEWITRSFVEWYLEQIAPEDHRAQP
jgi:Rieske 2Fe-2S family protein